MIGTPMSIATSRLRKSPPTSIWIWHLLGLFLLLSAASTVAWKTWAFWEVGFGRLLVVLSAGAYLAAAKGAGMLRRLPRAEEAGLTILVSSGAFLVVIVIVALGRFYYSRSFLLIVFAGGIFLLLLVGRIGSRSTVSRIAVVPGGMAKELMRIGDVAWVSLESPCLSGPVDGVAVDLHQKLSAQWVRFLSECSLKRIPVYHSAVAFEAATGRVSLSHLSEGVLEEFRLPPIYASLKRGIDLLLVLLSAPLVLPLVLLTALAVRIDSPGPVLFRQERMGQGGEIFGMLKFRSMVVDAEEQGAKFAHCRDGRVTRVGRFIRHFRLDELPQFWNILKGEMSLIGPRPEQVAFARQFEKEIPFYAYRHLVKPGITGWAQVTQGYAAGVDEARHKLEHDLYYIKYFSFWLDFWIAGKTLRTILTGFGAR